MPTRFVHDGVLLFQASERHPDSKFAIGELLIHNEQSYTIIDIEHWSRKDGAPDRCRIETTVHLHQLDEESLRLRRARHVQSSVEGRLPKRY